MEQKPFETPILFIVFNRPDVTARVFEEIRKIRPAQLFVTADGPREGRAAEAELCKKTRDIATNVDWPCEVRTLFQEKNLGVKYGPAAGIDWFFNNVEEGIVLEDDDLPDPTFFTYCQELLEKYRTDERVMHISGVNVLQSNPSLIPKDSYYFLSIPSVWGWASWRRAWKHYDVEVSDWPEVRDKRILFDSLEGAVAFQFGRKFQMYYERKINAYDGPWMFACLANHGLTIYPSRNLISYIGYGVDSTNSAQYDPMWANRPTQAMLFPMQHPSEVVLNRKADVYNLKISYGKNQDALEKFKWWVKSTFPDAYLFAKRTVYKTLWRKHYTENIYTDERALIK